MEKTHPLAKPVRGILASGQLQGDLSVASVAQSSARRISADRHEHLATVVLVVLHALASHTHTHTQLYTSSTEPRIPPGSLNRLGREVGGSVAEWLACWTQAQKDPGSNRSRDAVG